jgi:uncharacterized protein (TIGR02145 family)
MKKTCIKNMIVLSIIVLMSFGLYSCSVNFETHFNVHSPSVSTLDSSTIARSSLTLWGEVTDEGNDDMEEVGFCYNLTGNPSLENGTKVICDYDTLKFSATITGLEKSTTYYVVAYATNSVSTSYGSVLELKTVNYEFEYFTDTRDNKKYKTVAIGNQVWMAENLAFLPELNYQYSDYENYPNYYVYNYSGTSVEEAKQTANYKKYGVLYNWFAAQTSIPAGWRIPTKGDWEILAKYVSDQSGGFGRYKDEWFEIGTLLKAENGWRGTFDNEFGFSVLPANYYEPQYGYDSDGVFTYFWTSTEGEYNSIYTVLIQRDNPDLMFFDKWKHICCSIRLIKE